MTQKEYPKDYTRDYQKPYVTEKETMNSRDFIIGALIGGVVGAATALFMAPKSGKELMSDINGQARNISERTGKITRVAMEKGGSIAGTAKEKTSSVGEMVSNTSSGLINKVKSMTSSGKNGTQNEQPEAQAENEAAFIETGTVDVDQVPQETIPTTTTADASSSSSTTPGANAAQMKLDETKKAFEETENKLKE
ncbi:YtxH domain-containing protein [Peribacillus sp. SCS-155]|uniref:YtxH domain-containing protein n=1 Tax=Peribacillus sedimenti TaxID=3115297 RepID=UPI003906BC96